MRSSGGSRHRVTTRAVVASVPSGQSHAIATPPARMSQSARPGLRRRDRDARAGGVAARGARPPFGVQLNATIAGTGRHVPSAVGGPDRPITAQVGLGQRPGQPVARRRRALRADPALDLRRAGPPLPSRRDCLVLLNSESRISGRGRGRPGSPSPPRTAAPVRGRARLAKPACRSR